MASKSLKVEVISQQKRKVRSVAPPKRASILEKKGQPVIKKP